MTLKKTLALCFALTVLVAAVPVSADVEKKRKDGPDEPKLISVIVEHAGTSP